MANTLLLERDLTKIPPKININWVNAFLMHNPDIKVKFVYYLAYSQALYKDLVIMRGICLPMDLGFRSQNGTLEILKF